MLHVLDEIILYQKSTIEHESKLLHVLDEIIL